MSFKFSSIISTALLSLVAVTSFILPGNTISTQALATQGGISISPTDSDPNEKFTKGWFIDKLEPGQTVEKSLTLSNNSDTEKTAIISPEDYIQGGQGAFDFTDKQEIKNVGTWIKLSKTEVTIPARKAAAVKFTITVPNSINPGEYAGVLSVQEAPKAGQGSGFNVVSRVGARIYITIPGDLKTGFTFDNFKFITPNPNYTDSELYKEFLKLNTNSLNDAVFLNLKFRNTGNVFAKLSGNIVVTTPDNETISTSFNRDYASFDPFVEVRYFPIQKTQWKAGKWKAVFTFENPPIIESNKSGFKNTSPTQVVETIIDISQADLDKYLADMKKAKEDKDVPNVQTTKPSSSSQNDQGLEIKAITSSESAKEVKKEDKDNNIVIYVIGGVIILLLLAIIGFLVYKEVSKKKTEKEDSKKTSELEDTSSKKESTDEKSSADKAAKK